MKRLRSLLGPGFCASVAVLIGSAACTSPFTTTSGGIGGLGGAGSTGSGGPDASAGTGGAKCTATSCQAGEYCDSSSLACTSCADVSRFQFGTPVATHVTVPTTGSTAWYPRPNQDTGDLYLVQQDTTTAHQNQIAVAPMMPGEAAWTQAMLLPQLAGMNNNDSGPLYISNPGILAGLVDPSVSSSPTPVLLFDSIGATSTQVFAAILATPDAAPPPPPSMVNLPGHAMHASKIAASVGASSPRFWWISDATTSDAGPGVARLVTGTATEPLPGDVAIPLENGCPSPLADTPWVTPKGERLLFSSVQTDASASCAQINTSVTHLYQIPLSSDGTANGEGNASLIFPNDEALENTPALTKDMCTLLFARFDAQDNGQIYAAPRK